MGLLAVDVGNSEIALGVRLEARWAARWRLRTSDRRTADEYRQLVRGLFLADGLTLGTVRSVAISSVVPSVTPLVASVATALFGVEPLVVAPGIRTGMVVRYDPPAALGSDRILDAVAARARLGAPVVVVDLGTATTFTVVDREGALAGGAIAPGVGVAAEALAHFGARLRRVDLSLQAGVPVIGRNTESGMRSGILHGHAALVEGLLERIRGELDAPGPVPAVATGGLSPTIAPLTRGIDVVDPGLTLDGLCIIHELNSA